ncbi:MAG TPA: hypothetical protein PK335_05560 [Draconibacterium sp.]|nr:hypothetical protein [Draconibacterium sp.]
MKYLFGVLIGILFVSFSFAQNKPDPNVFTRPVEIKPNPPKSVKGWTFIDNWTESKATSKKEQQVSVLIGEYPGQIINFPFSGKAVGIAVFSDADAGMIEYSVDERDWQVLDLFSETPELKYFTLEADLKGKKHMLQIRVSSDKNPNSKGQKCILRYFVTNK